jgi:hypothetical protein
MLGEMWSNAPDRQQYAKAAATVHCIRGGLLVPYVAIGVYKHAAFVHIHELSATMAKYASVYLEAASAVWNWGAGQASKDG